MWNTTLRKITNGVGLSLLLLSTAACGGGEVSDVEHTQGYAGLRCKVTECDTVGFAEMVCRMQSSGNNGETADSRVAATDADVLLAWFYCQREDADSTIYFSLKALQSLYAQPHRIVPMSNWGGTVADMEYVLATGYDMEGKSDLAMAHLEKSYNTAVGVCYPHRMAQVDLKRARINKDLRNYQECLSNLREAEMIIDTTAEEAIETPCRMVALSECASQAIDLCDMATAERVLAKASMLYDKTSDRSKILYLRQLVRFRFLFGQYSQASSSLNRIEMLVAKTGQNNLLSDALALQGLSRCRMGELEWAKQYRDRVNRKDLSPQGIKALMLLDAEVAMLSKEMNIAKAYLFDTLSMTISDFPFDRVMVAESRRTYWVISGNYEKAYDLYAEERMWTVNMRNDILAPAERQRELMVQYVTEEQVRKELQKAEDRDSTTFLILYLLIILSFATTAIAITRLRMRNRVDKAEQKSSGLQIELNNKVAELEKQTKILEETNARIASSITYAEYIQHSISPSPDSLTKYPISGSFVFLSPLDVIGGDFFWYTNRGDELILCCADCTGHGVPGALMSMIATTLLNDICKRIEGPEVSPAQILTQLDATLVENLAHNRSANGGSKDGLDIAITVLNTSNHRIRVASARRPVVVFKGGNMTTIAGTKRSIGDLNETIRERQFTDTDMQLDKGDKFYMYSDGYSDQFGGRDGDKMRNTKVERFLQSINNDDMDEQSLTIQEFFVQWKGDYPQVDDVLFMGICV